MRLRTIAESIETYDLELVWDKGFRIYMMSHKTEKGKKFIMDYTKGVNRAVSVTKSMLDETVKHIEKQGLTYKLVE